MKAMETVYTIPQIDALKNESDMMLVYFGSESCGVCKSILPRLLMLLLKYPHVKAVRAELSDAPELAAACGIFTVPALILFVMGKESLREAGFISLTELEQALSKYSDLLFQRP